MPITEQAALDLLAELIKKPESKADEIPRIWGELITVYNSNFAPPAEPVKRKKRRRPGNPNMIGWPQGVSRSEYKAWKEAQEAAGVTTGINPQAYKVQHRRSV